jgi:hypothetical protein
MAKNSSSTVPAQVRAEEEGQPDRARPPFERAEAPADALGVDGLLACVDVPVTRLGVEVVEVLAEGLLLLRL